MAAPLPPETVQALSAAGVASKYHKIVAPHLHGGEMPFVVLDSAAASQALLGFEDHIMIVKKGVLAGSMGGGRATSFYYQDILGIEVNTGMLSAVIEIVTAGYAAGDSKDFWTKGKNQSPHQASNCLPTNKAQVAEWAPKLEALRAKLREAKTGGPSPAPQAAPVTEDGLVEKLQKLGELHASGVLNDEEFASAKQKLIEG